MSSFETLLDEKRGGPQPLTKEMLVSGWKVKDIFKRKKRPTSGVETHSMDISAYVKKELVNDFFIKVLNVGGEVLSSSRAMQDFFQMQDGDGIEATYDDPRTLKKVASSCSPSKPVLSHLKQESQHAMEPTEELSGSPSWQSTFASTPVSATASERKLGPWRGGKGRPEAQYTTPTRASPAPGQSYYSCPLLNQSKSSLLKIDASAGICEYDRQSPLSKTSETPPPPLYSHLLRSVSQQDLRSDQGSWRQDVNRAAYERSRKLSTNSSATVPLHYSSISPAATKPPSTKSKTPSPEGAVILTATRAKASGWRIIKGSEGFGSSLNECDSNGNKIPPSRASDGKQSSTSLQHHQQRQDDYVSIKGSEKQSNILATQSVQKESRAYIPSDLERLIFGDGKSDTPSVQADIFHDVEHLDDEDDQIASTNRGGRQRIDRKASYKVKGRASGLRLNLSGRSNMTTSSMLASGPSSAPLETTRLKVVPSSSVFHHSSSTLKTFDKREGTLRLAESSKSWRESSISYSDRPAPTLKSTKRSWSANSHLTLSSGTHSLVQSSPLQMAAFLGQSQLDRSRRGGNAIESHMHRLTVDPSSPATVDREAAIIEREVMEWKASQGTPTPRRRIANRF
ncbi:hypothetical protein CBS101457_006002 [Exobasidium rhododendri]|nr:hypothetical protein CBS101457_006002 [Exobasidium rhododendri]